MPYLHDPRRRITLNFHAALAADAARAGHAGVRLRHGPGRARGAALHPVVDENGARRVARLQGKLAVAQEALAACHAARAADADQRRALESELAARPGRAEFQRLFNEAMETALAERDAVWAAAPPTPAEAARAQRRAPRAAAKDKDRARRPGPTRTMPRPFPLPSLVREAKIVLN